MLGSIGDKQIHNSHKTYLPKFVTIHYFYQIYWYRIWKHAEVVNLYIIFFSYPWSFCYLWFLLVIVYKSHEILAIVCQALSSELYLASTAVTSHHSLWSKWSLVLWSHTLACKMSNLKTSKILGDQGYPVHVAFFLW